MKTFKVSIKMTLEIPVEAEEHEAVEKANEVIKQARIELKEVLEEDTSVSAMIHHIKILNDQSQLIAEDIYDAVI